MNQIRIAKVLAFVVLVVGAMVMTGWFFDIPTLKSVLPQWVTMKFTTALCFFVSGLILFFVAQFHAGKKNYAKLFLPVLSFIIMLFMTSMLFGVFFNIHLGLEDLFVREASNAIKTTVPGRPSAVNMFAFTLIAILGFVHTLKIKQLSRVTLIGGGIIAWAGLMAIVGYILNAPLLYYTLERVSTAMAFHTALLFVLTGVGFVLLGKENFL